MPIDKLHTDLSTSLFNTVQLDTDPYINAQRVMTTLFQDALATLITSRKSALFVAFMLIAAVTFTVPARGDSSQERSHVPNPPDVRGMCRPGDRIEVRFGSTSLHIDPRWIDLYDVFQKYGHACPSGPVNDVPLHFKPNVLPLMGAPEDLGKPFFFLTIRTPIGGEQQPSDRLPSTQVRPRNTATPWAEDITRLVFDPKDRRPSDRVYRLHYPGAGDNADVDVSCGGAPDQPGGRTCFTAPPYLYKRDLLVRYEYRQDHLPPADSERAAVLEFDVRLRAWLDQLARDLGGQK